MALSYIGLGSNLGDSLSTLKEALGYLAKNPQVEVFKTSSFYRTAPVGFKEQDDFVNAVAMIKTTLSPLDLLDLLMQTEQEFKRVRLFKNGPRTLDLDILLYDDLILRDEPKLNVPHPRMCERAFVLIPLKEIAPTLLIPGCNKSVSELCASLSDADVKDVRLLDHA